MPRSRSTHLGRYGITHPMHTGAHTEKMKLKGFFPYPILSSKLRGEHIWKPTIFSPMDEKAAVMKIMIKGVLNDIIVVSCASSEELKVADMVPASLGRAFCPSQEFSCLCWSFVFGNYLNCWVRVREGILFFCLFIYSFC